MKRSLSWPYEIATAITCVITLPLDRNDAHLDFQWSLFSEQMFESCFSQVDPSGSMVFTVCWYLRSTHGTSIKTLSVMPFSSSYTPVAQIEMWSARGKCEVGCWMLGDSSLNLEHVDDVDEFTNCDACFWAWNFDFGTFTRTSSRQS